LTADFAAQHPDDDYPPAWAYGPWWVDFAFCAYLFVRTALAFALARYGPDDALVDAGRVVWPVLLVVAVVVAILRFRERRRWRLPKDMRP